MPHRLLPSVVLFVDDVERLTDFYRQLAAMHVVHAEASHTILQLDGIQLVIHALPRADGAPPAQPVSPQPREDSYLKFCLPVASIALAREVASTLGGSIKAGAHEWEARGFRACDGHDSEGNVIQVREVAVRELD